MFLGFILLFSTISFHVQAQSEYLKDKIRRIDVEYKVNFEKALTSCPHAYDFYYNKSYHGDIDSWQNYRMNTYVSYQSGEKIKRNIHNENFYYFYQSGGKRETFNYDNYIISGRVSFKVKPQKPGRINIYGYMNGALSFSSAWVGLLDNSHMYGSQTRSSYAVTRPLGRTIHKGVQIIENTTCGVWMKVSAQ